MDKSIGDDSFMVVWTRVWCDSDDEDLMFTRVIKNKFISTGNNEGSHGIRFSFDRGHASRYCLNDIQNNEFIGFKNMPHTMIDVT